ncbi:L-seryl-tRNA(Ser) seleniumtransferase [Anaerosolibacter carboniphilus]|uniref:L-seryl-tRNA(Sec) selenium transferase n=1 Tax=Anaerosolibacter carboniphilus TaxID=1417629 RepID=A0A841KXE7_9FIRM|nr:L-seryl-tRNA(Sec) selenium transferase [Anaerosolibacter carboniphilus]MBB6214859.1 L-seryl-tRNA(Ser) seleniumtransferase [Anaerosolibacter carboniphilus]
MPDKKSLFTQIPKIDDILNEDKICQLLMTLPRIIVLDVIRKNIEEIRMQIAQLSEEKINEFQLRYPELLEKIIRDANEKDKMSLTKVVNTTGVILHTNLGRALLSDEIKAAVWNVASSYSTLEIDVKTGKRGSRYVHVEDIITRLTGAESALVVNNNAAAVLLVLSTMAKNKEVIVSRGQLVEIGGSFRVPEVMEQSGALLREVGSTNKTHLFDYERAIREETGALLKVHTSNYRILGFTEEVGLKELVELGRKHCLPVIEDIGSGTFIDFSKYGLAKEPTVQESVAAGVDIITFSGDKLLGGPQAGIIIGKKKYIDLMKKNPLTRAFRVDKMTLAALEATLKIYFDEEDAIKRIPTLHMITMKVEEIESKAQRLKELLKQYKLPCSILLNQAFSQIGGGSMPLVELPSWVIQIKPNQISVNELEKRLREYRTPIITRIQDEQLVFDVRTIKEEEYALILNALVDVMEIKKGDSY